MVRYSRHRKGRNTRSIDEALGSSGNQIRFWFGDLGVFGIKPFKMYDSMNYMNDYLKNRKLTWNDVKYPSLIGSSGGASGVYETNTRSIERLYGIKTPYEPPSRDTPWNMYG